MSDSREDLKPIARQCPACGATFWVSATLPRRMEPDVCRACDEEYEEDEATEPRS
jgi:uncharacterized protein (DUF983 family)